MAHPSRVRLKRCPDSISQLTYAIFGVFSTFFERVFRGFTGFANRICLFGLVKIPAFGYEAPHISWVHGGFERRQAPVTGDRVFGFICRGCWKR